ncbi:hypothetical protein EV673_2902 [Limnobacter thiooxidans]|uniref:Uncharacterized protein n=1 Tax=Limnobacter thiooxidans TaxID=131080 RepID=A0AA86MCM3_9BURK|nr:hypothetical protein EV673_2902 [Limnobacter thiooxidans]BET25031.1 hypothetical protein RGQ30_05320 [Limnobacter thiooxidans]
MPASKRATEETSKTATKAIPKVASKASAKPAMAKVVEEAAEVAANVSENASASRPVASTRKPSKTALSPSEVTPLALLTPSKPARRRRSGAAKPRKLKGATTTWPFPTGSRP